MHWRAPSTALSRLPLSLSCLSPYDYDKLPLLCLMNLQHLHSFGDHSLRYEPTRPLANLLEMNDYPARPEANGF